VNGTDVVLCISRCKDEMASIKMFICANLSHVSTIYLEFVPFLLVSLAHVAYWEFRPVYFFP